MSYHIDQSVPSPVLSPFSPKSWRKIVAQNMCKKQLALASFLDNEDDDQLIFDADLYLIAVDNCASCTMTNQESDLFDTITVHQDILGIGSVHAIKMGTFHLRFQDDQGMVHEHLIPDSYYSPDLPI